MKKHPISLKGNSIVFKSLGSVIYLFKLIRTLTFANMEMNTILTGELLDYPTLVNTPETDTVLLKVMPHSGPFLHDIVILCKGSLAKIVMSYFKLGTVIEVDGSPANIDKAEYPLNFPEPVVEAKKIRFLYIQKMNVDARVGEMVM